MGLLDSLLGGQSQQQDYQGFVNRYQQGPPSQGYSDQEVLNRYGQVAPQLAPGEYEQAAEQAFSRMSPQERADFAQHLQQQAQQQSYQIPGWQQGASAQQYQDPRSLATMTSQMHQQQPGFLGQLLGGGGGMLANPAAKAALAGIAAMAVSNALGGGGLGSALGGALGGGGNQSIGGGTWV